MGLVAESFYERLSGAVFRPTAATESPWDADAQHGGPPSALLARAIESTVIEGPLRIAKFDVDYFGQIPRADCTIEVYTRRPGRRVRLVEATMSVGGQVVVGARAWLIAAAEDRAPASLDPLSLPPVPEPQEFAFDGLRHSWGYGEAIDWRFVAGGFESPGSAQLWVRPRVPLLADEPMSDLQRLLVVADSANGVSGPLPFDRWWFIPPGLTVTVQRPPEGEWIFMDARTEVEPTGIGLTRCLLADRHGSCGRALQALFVAPR